ncbi:MAG: hypothetical protein H0W81_00905 [Chloroflexi bacterium]|nr:hypothetical protein [Chloroflexota bacterium]
MTSAGFVLAAYGVILGGMGLYAALLARRLRIARDTVRRNNVDLPE